MRTIRRRPPRSISLIILSEFYHFGGVSRDTSSSGKCESMERMFTPIGEGGSGRWASATENTQYFSRLNVETSYPGSESRSLLMSGLLLLMGVWVGGR